MPKVGLKQKKKEKRIRIAKKQNEKKNKLAFDYFIKDFAEEVNNEQ